MTSTTLLMLREPVASSLCLSHSGEGAIRMPSTTRAMYRLQSREFSIVTLGSAVFPDLCSGGTGLSLPRPIDPISRARPRTDMQSVRFDVISTSRIASPRPSNACTGLPTRGEPGRTQIPSASSESPSSRSEQIMPSDPTPRILLFRSFVPSGRRAPICATATDCPPATFEAPHTIDSFADPTSTEQRRRRSAFGWGDTSSTRPTMIAGSSEAPCSIEATGNPRMASACARASGVGGRSTQSASQPHVTFIVAP